MKFKGLILGLSLALLPLGSTFARLSVDSASGLNAEGLLEDGATVTIWVHMTHDYAGVDVIASIDNGFWVYDRPDGSLSWGDLHTAKNPAYVWDMSVGCLFDGGFFLNIYGDTVGFGGWQLVMGTGLPYGWDDWAYQIIVGPITVNVGPEEEAELWIDSCFYPPSNHWEWTVSLMGSFKPVWEGPYHWSTTDSPHGTTDIEDREGSSLPTEFALQQNYPNPFNPNTRIRCEIPRSSHVSLVVYNALGQKIRTLVNETRGPGRFVVEWDGRNDQGEAVSSGVYLYRLQAGDYSQTRKAILMK